MADTKISALAAASAAAATNDLYINEAGTSKRLPLDLIRDYIYKTASGTSMARGDYESRLVLASDQTFISASTVIMTMTGLDAGRYYFKCQLVWQNTDPTGRIALRCNHTGGVNQFVMEFRKATTGTAAATGVPTSSAVGATGAIYEAQGTRTVSTLMLTTAAPANTDYIGIIEGYVRPAVTGDFTVAVLAQTANYITARQGSYLELKKLS